MYGRSATNFDNEQRTKVRVTGRSMTNHAISDVKVLARQNEINET